MWIKRAVFLLTFLVVSSIACAIEHPIQIIELKNRPAQEIAPILRPLLAQDDALSASGFRLILRTSEARFKEIQKIIHRLDAASRNLTITVRHEIARASKQIEYEISGETGRDVRIRLPRNSENNNTGLNINGSDPSGLRVHTQRRDDNNRDSRTQLVRVLEGQRAYIRLGQSAPHVQKILVLTGHQAVIAQGIELQSVATGFDVTPQLQGENVRLEITPRLSTIENPTTGLTSFQELTTTLIIKLGEWVDLSQILENTSEVNRSILASIETSSNEKRTVLLKVE